jgi:membrane associated rhomboid family serine protease
VIGAFSFIPARVLGEVVVTQVPNEAARAWSFLSYAFLHGDWTHVLLNVLWLVAFGSPLAWRFGAPRFLAFSAVGAIAGGLAHLAVYPHDATPMVGASAALSAHMAAVSRFAFTRGGLLFGGRGAEAYRVPAPPLAETFRDPRVLAFVGVWFGVNIVFGLAGAGSGLANVSVAWDAHVGGFLAGLLLFSLFDRR